MKNVEEYLYYHENEDYAYLKFVSCTYYRRKKRLVVRYVYAQEISELLPKLKKRLEELFIQQVGLPLKYDFYYQKVFTDPLVLQLEIYNYLRQKFAALMADVPETAVKVLLDNSTWQVNLFLKKSLIEFLSNSQQWQNFKRDLAAKNLYEFIFHFNEILS